MDRDDTTTRVADAVREAMTERHVSQAGLAEATGIARVTLIRRLQGHVPFTVRELGAIAEHLGMVASDFVKEPAA